MADCLHCSSPIPENTGRGRPRKFCSKACLWTVSNRRSGARPIAEIKDERRRAALRQCAECGSEFLPRNGDNAWRCCSKPCDNIRRGRSALLTVARREMARWATTRTPCARLLRLRTRLQRASEHCIDCANPIGSQRAKRRGIKLCQLCVGARALEAKKAGRKKRKAHKRSVTTETVSPLKVFMRDGWRCHLCGGSTDKQKRGTLHPNAPELDHIVPLSKGGPHSYANTACAHKRCNAAKSDKIMGQPSLLAA